MAQQKQLIALILCICMMLTAGCAGWGTDGPASPETDDGTDDAETQAQEEADETSTDDGSSSEDDADQSNKNQDSGSDDGDSSASADAKTNTGSNSDSESDAASKSNSDSDADADSNSDSASKSGSQSSVNASPSSESNAKAEGGSTEVNVNIDNSDSTTVNAESESDSKSSAGSSSSASSASGSSSDGSSSDSTAGASSTSGSDSGSGSESSSNTNSDGDNEDEQANQDREVYTLTVTAGDPEPVENVDVTIKRHSDGATTTKTTGGDGQVTFDVYADDYTVTGVDERREEQAERVTVPDQQSVVLDQMERPVGDIQGNYLTVVDQNGDPVEEMYIEATTSLPGGKEHQLESKPVNDGSVYIKGHQGETYHIQKVHDGNGNSYPVTGVVVDGQKYDRKMPYKETSIRIEIEHPGSFPNNKSDQAAAA